MEYESFDTRRYPTLSARDGYGEWSATYEKSVEDEMDLRLLNRLTSPEWGSIRNAIDLACGTGRIGQWLKLRGVAAVDGIDLTPEMLAKAEEKKVYQKLLQGNILQTGLPDHQYDLAIEVLADEHLSDLGPLYLEAARITAPEACFITVGYHPHFLMNGLVTHFHRASGEAVAIRSYVHLLSDHFKAAQNAGFAMAHMDEGIVDEDWLKKKPKWEKYRNRPVSFLFVWRKVQG